MALLEPGQSLIADPGCLTGIIGGVIQINGIQRIRRLLRCQLLGQQIRIDGKIREALIPLLS